MKIAKIVQGVIIMLKATNIKWNTDGDMEVLNDLPTEMTIPNELEEMYKKDKEYALEKITDWLSDETGFCHDGFELEKGKVKKTVKNELIENPCYHCYEGASGQCYMTHCKHQFEEWAKDVESEYVKIN